jgi:hypothetical protein
MEMQMPILPPTISPASSGEPVEIRRVQTLTNYAPIPIDEFSTHLEHLKAADNYKFSQEYEVRERKNKMIVVKIEIGRKKGPNQCSARDGIY